MTVGTPARIGGRPDNRLDYADQVMFLNQIATGQEAVCQLVWVYRRAVDLDAVKRFYRRFGQGIYGRLIERSPLPFGRHRWVRCHGPQAPLDIDPPRPPEALSDWADERAQMPIDPERGPGWRMAVLPMTDGSTAVTFVGSHCLGDGVGTFAAIADAVTGTTRDLGYPPPRSVSRARAAARDLRETARDLPLVARTLVTAGRLTWQRRRELLRPVPKPTVALPSDADEAITVPAASVYIDLAAWDARAESLGGNAHSMMAGFAARLADRIGRRRAADGAVTLNIPISDRAGEQDTRANAVLLTNISIDPTVVTTDLGPARAAIREGLRAARETPDEMLQLLPLAPFIPKRAVRQGGNAVFGFVDDLPVSCSNLGDVDPTVTRIDGTPADFLMLRGVDRHVTRRFLETRPGLLTVVGGRIAPQMSITVVGYHPGAPNTKPWLREQIAAALADFDLSGVIH
ncbi:hypothetical protein [uncultured Mycolicibacterium sp.]|uniref:hypothetical protein n=1 Tax=uncultured Mycolicibacterium sp. TaxID=2320817 RepID=UPI002627CEF6|nr:hypothetical protein [uncultured Mycolicibacterium sp.]